MTSATRPLIGVLTYRHGSFLAGSSYCAQLTAVADRHKCVLIVYSPTDIDEAHGTVQGFRYNTHTKKWVRVQTRTPDIVYDRFSYMRRDALRIYSAYRSKSRMRYVNNRFAHKWNAHRHFSHHPELSRHLPVTVSLTSGALGKLTRRFPLLYAKPVNGSGGKGILRIRRHQQRFEMVGRNGKEGVIRHTAHSLEAAERYVLTWAQQQKQTFVLQQGLSLSLIPGMICDSRVLVQKDVCGQWRITGMVGKQSPDRLVTSNLQSGGKATSMLTLLTRRFSAEKAESIMQSMQHISLLLASHIESRFGNFLEFGIDLGIDTNGYVWIIEVNPKPNRELFRLAGQHDTYKRAIEAPILYALSVLKMEKN